MPNWVRKVYRFIVHHNTLTAITFLVFGAGCYVVYRSTATDKLSTLASMATALAIVVAMIQLLASNRQHRESSRRAAAEKAIELAKYFQSDLVRSISFMTSALSAVGYSKFEDANELTSVPLRFSREELVDLFGKSILAEIQKADNKIEPSIIKYAATVTAHSIVVDPQENNANFNFRAERINILNTLEWFAMTLNTGVADEKVIYQSLHQLLLSYIQLEYPTIALLNTDASGADQYFTNIIRLYNTWQTRKNKQATVDHNNRAKNINDEKRLQQKKQNRRNSSIKFPPQV